MLCLLSIPFRSLGRYGPAINIQAHAGADPSLGGVGQGGQRSSYSRLVRTVVRWQQVTEALEVAVYLLVR